LLIRVRLPPSPPGTYEKILIKRRREAAANRFSVRFVSWCTGVFAFLPMNKSIRIIALAALAGCLAIPRMDGEPAEEQSHPAEEQNHVAAERIVPLTKEQLISKMPHFYAFDYRGAPQPGKRYWLRVDNSTWIERYPDGLQHTFKIIGHTTVQNIEGTVVVRVNGVGDGNVAAPEASRGLQAFIPDKGSALMHHWYRNMDRGDTGWRDLGPMLAVE
jgi:hypothetical protein